MMPTIRTTFSQPSPNSRIPAEQQAEQPADVQNVNTESDGE